MRLLHKSGGATLIKSPAAAARWNAISREQGFNRNKKATFLRALPMKISHSNAVACTRSPGSQRHADKLNLPEDVCGLAKSHLPILH